MKMEEPQVNDGGRAFPSRNRWDSGNESFDLESSGMTLRDYFAGQALPGIAAKVYMTKEYKGPFMFEDIADEAYVMADEMIKRRQEGPRSKTVNERQV
jgi:hypothetical protein